MIVLDASVVVDFLLRLEPHAEAITTRILDEAPDLAAPHLLDVEVAQVLRRFVLRGEVTPERAEAALDDLADLPLVRYPHLPMLRRAFELRENLTTYDGVYVALAEALSVTLLTRDSAIGAAPGHVARVEVIA